MTTFLHLLAALAVLSGIACVLVLGMGMGYASADREHRRRADDIYRDGVRDGRRDAVREQREAAKARLRKALADRANLEHMVTDTRLHALIDEYQRWAK